MFKKIILAIIALFFLACFGPRAYRHFTRTAPAPIPPRAEVTLTIIPGWNLRQVAEYLVLKGLASSTLDVYKLTGEPGVLYQKDCTASNERQKSLAPCPSKFYATNEIGTTVANYGAGVSLEGYLAPDTYRVFADASLESVIQKFLDEYNQTFAKKYLPQDNSRTWLAVQTMASIIEKETRHPEDRAIVSDILWRRYEKNWALQVDSSVHYIVDRMGDAFTTNKERQIDSPWNTYKYPGLPPGPICNPSTESIDAALHPTPNKYWYFLTGRDGKMYYAKTLEEHNANKKHL